MACSKSDKIPVIGIPDDARINRLNNLFIEEFGYKPSFFVRVPGRVNLIGEHIDYCGYPVLPMALEQDILIAATRLNESHLKIRNVNKKYSEFNYMLTNFENIKIEADNSGRPHWYNYVLCGIKGAMEYMDEKNIFGLQLFIDGNVPPASGLSSSSALVSAACLSFLYANNIKITKSDIAALCARCERYIGTEGGGMDQAIAFLAEKSSAQYITWQPLNATAVELPKEATFVVAHSLAEANKAATNDFNRRVIECRLAAKILSTITSDTANNDTKILTLSQVQALLDKSLEDMIQLVLKHLPQTVYTKEEISKILNIGQADLESIYLTPNTKHINEFKLKQRALHVYEEAKRVEKFRMACSRSISNGNGISNGNKCVNQNGDSTNDNTLQILGKLMSESHESLKNDYECSHENLDRLVEISKEMNVHSRLTGAGWGGCIVALCPKEKANDYIKHLKKHFYAKHCKIEGELADKYVFATIPNHGAVIYTNE